MPLSSNFLLIARSLPTISMMLNLLTFAREVHDKENMLLNHFDLSPPKAKEFKLSMFRTRLNTDLP
jgi:hypothetical protein